MSSSGVPLLATIMVLLFFQYRIVLSDWSPELDESSDNDYAETDDSDMKRIGELLSWPSPHPFQVSYSRICAQNLCRRVRNRFQLQVCIRRNCHPFSVAAAVVDLGPIDGGPRMRRLVSLRRPCSSPSCVGENEDPVVEDEEEIEYTDEDEASSAISSASFDGQPTDPSSLDDAATWWAAAERRHKTNSCRSICRSLVREVIYGSCVRYLCSSSISSVPQNGIKASSYSPVVKRHRQQRMTKQATNAEVEHHSIWKRYGMRICAEAFCKSHHGYELVACGLSRCHGK